MLGASIDTPFSQKVFAEQAQVQYSLVADPNRDWLRQVGILLPEVAGIREVCTRAAFVVGQDRHLLWKWQGPDTKNLPDVNEVLGAVRKLVR